MDWIDVEMELCATGQEQLARWVIEEVKKMRVSEMTLTLTGKEIKDLAESVGLVIQPLDYGYELETEMTIIKCPATGVIGDDGKAAHFEHVAYLSEYPDEGTYPLGDELHLPDKET